MQLSSLNRTLGRIAAILGVLQGLAWASMSLAAIILHNWSPTLEKPTDYTQILGVLLYSQFIQDSNESSSFIIRPVDFTIFMWIYFILSVGWLALSIDQFSAIYYGKARQKLIIFLWGIVTLITSLIDLIFASLLARDYANCDRDPTEVTLTTYFCYLAFGITMTIAARGYTLWLINVIFSFMMLRISTTMGKGSKLTNLFSNHNIPRVIIPRSTKTNDIPKSGELTPNFLNNEIPYSMYLNQSERFDKEDSLPSLHDRSKSGNDSIPSFLSRGDRFSY